MLILLVIPILSGSVYGTAVIGALTGRKKRYQGQFVYYFGMVGLNLVILLAILFTHFKYGI